MKRIILIITCLCNIPMLFSQHDISDYVKVIGVKYIDNVSVFDYYRKTSRHKMVGVCKIKLTSLITDSLYFYKLRNNIPLQGESFMDSALFDVNCFVYQDLPYRFVAEYILPCIKDTQYADTIKKTYYKYMANPIVQWGKKQKIQKFSTQRLYHHKFLIVEMTVGFYNEYGKIWNPQLYRYSEKPEDANRCFRFAIPLKENE